MSGRAGSHGKHHKRRRGTHKRARSPETIRWESEQLMPKRPPWLDVATYVRLAKLRSEL